MDVAVVFSIEILPSNSGIKASYDVMIGRSLEFRAAASENTLSQDNSPLVNEWRTFIFDHHLQPGDSTAQKLALVRAAKLWVSEHIAADYEKSDDVHKGLYTNDPDYLQTPFQTLIRQKGVCGDHAALIRETLNEMGFSRDDTSLVIGTVHRPDNTIERHMLAMITIDGERYVVNNDRQDTLEADPGNDPMAVDIIYGRFMPETVLVEATPAHVERAFDASSSTMTRFVGPFKTAPVGTATASRATTTASATNATTGSAFTFSPQPNRPGVAQGLAHSAPSFSPLQTISNILASAKSPRDIVWALQKELIKTGHMNGSGKASADRLFGGITQNAFASYIGNDTPEAQALQSLISSIDVSKNDFILQNKQLVDVLRTAALPLPHRHANDDHHRDTRVFANVARIQQALG